MALRHCWWCGRPAEVDTSLPESNGLLRDDSTFDGSESWICSDSRSADCVRRARTVTAGALTDPGCRSPAALTVTGSDCHRDPALRPVISQPT